MAISICPLRSRKRLLGAASQVEEKLVHFVPLPPRFEAIIIA